MLRKLITSLLLIVCSCAYGPAAVSAQGVSTRRRSTAPDDKVYIAYKNPADPGDFWYMVYNTELGARRKIRSIIEGENPDLNPLLKMVGRAGWYSDPRFRTRVIDGLRGRPTSRNGRLPSGPRGMPNPLPPGGSGSSSRGMDPPFDLRNVEQDVISGRNPGVRQVEPQVRSLPPRERLEMNEYAPRSQPQNGSTSSGSTRPGSRGSVQPNGGATRPNARGSAQPIRSDDRSRIQRGTSPSPSPSPRSSRIPWCGKPGCTIHT
jgi:hypothetical protein